MKNLLFILVLLAACGYVHRSGLKQERGIVVEKQYAAGIDAHGSGVGLSGSGDMVVTSSHIHEDEKYMLVFKCDHGVVFSVNNQELYARLDKGDTVTINFYELLEDGTNQVLSYQFESAFKIQ